jgi:uncharacterized OsmC-like protein
MAENPRRVTEIIIEFTFPDSPLTHKQKRSLENAARACPVSKSLHPDLKETVIFNWQ